MATTAKKRKASSGANAGASAAATPKRTKAGKAGSAAKAKKAPVDPVQALVVKHTHLSVIDNGFGKKVSCSITGHEMPAKAEEVEKYLASKRLFKAKNKWYGDDWPEQYLPDIIQHKKNPKQLYCLITKQTLNKIPDEVNKHVNGKRFVAAKNRVEEEKAAKAERIARRKERRAHGLPADSDDEESEGEDEDDEEMVESGEEEGAAEEGEDDQDEDGEEEEGEEDEDDNDDDDDEEEE